MVRGVSRLSWLAGLSYVTAVVVVGVCNQDGTQHKRVWIYDGRYTCGDEGGYGVETGGESGGTDVLLEHGDG